MLERWFPPMTMENLRKPLTGMNVYQDPDFTWQMDMTLYALTRMGWKLKRKKKSASVGLILYALPDTCKLGLTEAQAYAVVWKTFQEIQQAAPRAVVFYGQETGVKKENPEKPFDELGVLLPIHEFEKKMLQHMEEIDGIVLACRERMMELAGNDSLKL